MMQELIFEIVSMIINFGGLYAFLVGLLCPCITHLISFKSGMLTVFMRVSSWLMIS